MTWNVRPWVAQKYLAGVVTQFEEYANDNYVDSLSKPKTEPSSLLAALKFVQTRQIEGHERTLREIFTSRRGATPEVARTCLEAILTTSESRTDAARFFATVATDPHLSVSLFAEQGLWRLRPESVEALLVELQRPYDGPRRRRIVRLLTRLTDVRPPVPIKFWQDADAVQQAAAVESWRQEMINAGVWSDD